MSAIHTRQKENKFHEDRREAQRIRTFKGGFFLMKGPAEEQCCEWCECPVVSGIKINEELFHNECFNEMRKNARS